VTRRFRHTLTPRRRESLTSSKSGGNSNFALAMDVPAGEGGRENGDDRHRLPTLQWVGIERVDRLPNHWIDATGFYFSSIPTNPDPSHYEGSNPIAYRFRNQRWDLSLRSSRGDRTAIEHFLVGLKGWEAGLRRQMSDDKSQSE